MFSIKSAIFKPTFHVRFASKKSGGSTSNGRTSNPKFRGFKKMNGAKVESGNIILRQMGTKFHPGKGVGMGKDFTLYALEPGRVCIHYDLERQLKFVSIDEKKPSTKMLKKELKDSIDPSEYLKLSSEERYDYVMKKVVELVKRKKIEEKEQLKQSILDGNGRKFNLVDLTLI